MLKGTRINLRLVRESDLDDYIRLTHDIDARGPFFPVMLSSEPQIRHEFQESGFWSEKFRTMIIVDKVSDRMIGSISAFKTVFYHDALELGYILYDVSSRGKGIMAEAVRLYCGYLFRWQNIHRIQLEIETGHIASRRTAENAGFTHEGTIRHCLIVNGSPVDMEMYSIIRSEFERESVATD